MSNHKFIQVEPPKEELTLPASISDFTALSDAKGNTLFSVKMTSTVATFTGIGVGDYVELTVTDKNTLIERSLAVLKIQTITSVNDVESEVLDSTLTINSKILENLSDFITEYSTPKIYKLPTNSFSLQVKTDSIVRYYEDPVDKTIMYIDTLESPSICGNGGPGVCVDIWGHDRASLGIVTLNNTDKIPMHNIVPYLNSIFLEADDES